ncbi:hypothetical protein Q5762_30710 [Streptomyces sp. P9(2023)]|uniref:hypothetical protein n=1 Tax=Streptomyces sp. P9(2023) TaxID=3064394 RepID=UPI0028F43B7D|nr:hypothetical protein [Streptomyces sp. P9(2023)]MDT9692626.1 hypothetical protein [Streptomyces sp. P9(2023)]
MKKILTAALTGLALAGSIGAAGSAVADTADIGNANLPSVVPLSGLLNPQAKAAGPAARMPAANATVEGLLPGR